MSSPPHAPAHASLRQPGAITRLVGSGFAVVGALVVAIGLFLPWVRAGRVDRNSFEIVALVEKFRLVRPPWDSAMALWQFVGPAMMVPLVFLALRWWRTGGIMAILLGLIIAAGAITCLVLLAGERRLGVSLATTGPTFAMIGGSLLVVGGITVLYGLRKPHVSGVSDGQNGWEPVHSDRRLIEQHRLGHAEPGSARHDDSHQEGTRP